MPADPPADRARPWRALHRQAVATGALTYRDPASGASVMTELAHRARGSCCGSGCRHCPWDHAEVDPALRAVLDPPVTVERGG